MHFILAILITLWLWEFFKVYLHRAPEWFIHLGIVPSLAVLAWIIPSPVSFILAVAGAIVLIQMLARQSNTRPAPMKRKSNIPPPP